MKQIDKALEIDIAGGMKMMRSTSDHSNYTNGHENGNVGLTL